MPLSSITKLPTSTRSRWLRKISANANAPGGSKRQTNGRAQKRACVRLANTLGIYVIESNVTGALAASVGGMTPASIATNGGTPDPTAIAADELDAVTWAGAGAKVLVATPVAANVTGEAVVTV